MARIRKISADEWARNKDVWPHGCSIYLVQEEQSGPVKVGIAEHPIRRLSTLQCGNPRAIHLRSVFVGPRRDCALVEAAIKLRFADFILRGEWISAPLQAVIADLEAMAQ